MNDCVGSCRYTDSFVAKECQPLIAHNQKLYAGKLPDYTSLAECVDSEIQQFARRNSNIHLAERLEMNDLLSQTAYCSFE